MNSITFFNRLTALKQSSVFFSKWLVLIWQQQKNRTHLKASGKDPMEGGIISKQINADINWKAKSHFQSFDMYIYNQNDKWMIQMCQYAGTKLPRTTKTLTSFSSFWHRNETCVAGRLGEVKTQHWKCYIFLPMGNKICALTIRNLQIFLILRKSYWATVAVSISGLCCFHLSTGFLSCLLSTRTLTAYLSVRGAIIFNHVLVLVGLVGFCVGFFLVAE